MILILRNNNNNNNNNNKMLKIYRKAMIFVLCSLKIMLFKKPEHNYVYLYIEHTVYDVTHVTDVHLDKRKL